MREIASCLLLLCGLSGGVCLAQEPAASEPEGRVFTIGYLDEGCDLAEAAQVDTRQVVVRLRDALLADAEFSAGLSSAGYGEVVLRPCDGPYDMIQRLGVEEFELAFATAVIYGRLFLVNDFSGQSALAAAYDPVLQFRFLPPFGDIETPSGTMRQGVVFIDGDDDSPEATLGRSRWAVSNAYSAGGYIYPYLQMQRRFPEIQVRAPLFCGSEESVIKHVVSGLTQVGATEQRILARMTGGLPTGTGAGTKLSEVFLTDPYPTDPILMHRKFSPRAEHGELGRQAVAVMLEFFAGAQSGAPEVRVNKAPRRAYELMARALREFDQITRGATGPEAATGGEGSAP